jgi:hypothetical protein
MEHSVKLQNAGATTQRVMNLPQPVPPRLSLVVVVNTGHEPIPGDGGERREKCSEGRSTRAQRRRIGAALEGGGDVGG